MSLPDWARPFSTKAGGDKENGEKARMKHPKSFEAEARENIEILAQREIVGRA